MKDYVVDNDIGIMVLTETWLRPGNTNEWMLKWELCVLPAIGSYTFQDLILGEEELVCYLKTILISTPKWRHLSVILIHGCPSQKPSVY